MRHPVTPIFPKNNALTQPSIPENLPIRRLDSREHILRSGGFNGTPETVYNNNLSHGVAPPALNCINIAQHIDTCPICSRLYDTDKTLYILAIMGLLILCFLMVKRIVNL